MVVNGIRNFQTGFIVLRKENDINNHFMNEGESRIVYESDLLALKVNAFPYAMALKFLEIRDGSVYLK